MARFEKLLESQHGLITLAQLRQGEVKDDERQRLVRKRVLRRHRPRVFGLVGAPDTWERGLLAAILSIEGSVASHSSAARLWAMEPRPEERYEVTIGRRYRAEIRGVVFHASVTLDDEDVVRRQGIDCTSFERTLCDCTTMLSDTQLSRALDDGLRRGVASLRRLRGCAKRFESCPGRQMSVIRSLLAARGVGFDPGGSRSEFALLDVFRRAQLPAPVQQLRGEGGIGDVPARLRLAGSEGVRRVLRTPIPHGGRRSRGRQPAPDRARRRRLVAARLHSPFDGRGDRGPHRGGVAQTRCRARYRRIAPKTRTTVGGVF